MTRTNINSKKHTFFAQPLTTASDAILFTDDDFNLNQLNAEFSSLYQLVISNKKSLQKNSEIVAYLSYLCDLMIQYYKLDYVATDLAHLQKKRKEIDGFINGNFSLSEQIKIKTPTSFLAEKTRGYTVDCVPSMTSSARLHSQVSTLNGYRISWNTSRGLATTLITFLRKSHFFELMKETNQTIGNNYSPDDVINLLDNSREILRVLSVAIYALRLVINLMVMIKHIIQAAINGDLSARKVGKQEVEKRWSIILGDAAWGIVNLMTNYRGFFNISSQAASQITVVFLVFDVLLLIGRWLIEANNHACRLQELQTQRMDATAFEQAVIDRQRDILNDEWKAQCAYYMINIVAGNLLIIGLGATLIVSSAIALATFACVSMLGNALYNTATDYKRYQQACIATQREALNGLHVNDADHQQLAAILKTNCDKTHAAFWKTLAYNTGGTAFIITAVVFSWPIALGLTLMYVAYRMQTRYQEQLDGYEKTQEELPGIYRLFNTSTSSSTTNTDELRSLSVVSTSA